MVGGESLHLNYRFHSFLSKCFFTHTFDILMSIHAAMKEANKNFLLLFSLFRIFSGLSNLFIGAKTFMSIAIVS